MTYETFKQKANEFLDFNKASGKISYSLVNYRKNADWLCNIPHRKYLDLAIVYQAVDFIRTAGINTLLVDNGQMNEWGLNEPSLYQLAKENTPTLLPMQIEGIDNIILKLEEQCGIPESKRDEIRETLGMLDVPMYMATNTYQTYGAACILYDNALGDFAKKQGCDMFVLPSSVHEMMIIPDEGTVEADDLRQMIKDVNMSLDERERALFLSDSVYVYRRDKGMQFA